MDMEHPLIINLSQNMRDEIGLFDCYTVFVQSHGHGHGFPPVGVGSTFDKLNYERNKSIGDSFEGKSPVLA